MQGRACRYRVFLSYSHDDRRWARRIARLLETWRVPHRLVGQETAMGRIPRSLGPVFRDRDELSASAELGATISSALKDSDSMVVICSEAAAKSQWVNEEIRAFKAWGRADHIFAIIVSGDPAASDGPRQCFPPSLRFRVDPSSRVTDEPTEPVAADARAEGDGIKRARLKLLAGLLGIGYDQLKRREQHRRNRRLVFTSVVSIIGMVITIGLAVSAWIAQQDAERRREQAEELINFMVGDLHDGLKPIGKLELLDDAGNKALEYFASLNSRDMNDEILARQSQALVQVGEVKLELGDSELALEAFTQALSRAKELTARHPEEPHYVFDRGQAEYWVGYVHYRRGDYNEARSWFTRYRDSSRWLAEHHPYNTDWQMEAAYSEMNLGTLEFKRGRLEAAAEAYESSQMAFKTMLQATPDNREILPQLAESISWLGSIYQKQGRLATGQSHFQQSVSLFDAVRKLNDEDRHAEERWVRELGHLCLVLRIQGRNKDALNVCLQMRNAAEQLVFHDQQNHTWRRTFAHSLLGYGQALLNVGEPGAARPEIEAGLAELRSLVDDDPNTADWRIMLAVAHRLAARVELTEGDPVAAASLADMGIKVLDRGQDSADLLRISIERARLKLVAGQAASQLIDSHTANLLWNEGLLALVTAPNGNTNVPVISLRAELLALLDQCAEAESLIQQLTEMGVALPNARCNVIVSVDEG